ncbi:DoxX family membrane protein [Galbibacter orientalis]
MLIVRLTTGALMLFHGVDKLSNGILNISNLLESKGLPSFFSYGVFVF